MSWGKSMQRLATFVAAGAVASAALAQIESGAPWPSYRGNQQERAAITAPGPALSFAWRLTGVGTTSTGGARVAANGDVYFKTNDGDFVRVHRVSAGGTILASVNLITAGAGSGQYSGVTIGENEIYTSVASAGSPNGSKIMVLDKSTLAVLREYTNAAFTSIRCTPIISTFANYTDGQGRPHYTLYVSDRNGSMIHAMNADDGTLRWSYPFVIGATLVDGLGPLWTTTDGKQAIGYFRNTSLFAGMALRDDGLSATLLWEGGPDSFNWFGSGALSADGTRIYVTTFNDGNVPSLWAISTLDGSVIWSVPGARGTCDEFNFFPRPIVIGNRIYCTGGAGVMACFVDEGNTYSVAWVYRNGRGEFTGNAAARTPTGETYVYGITQEFSGQTWAEYVVLQDMGDHADELLRTSLNKTLKYSIFAGNSPAIASDGSVYFGSGRRDNSSGYEFYKFALGVPGGDTGGCCLPSGACERMTEADCDTQNGTYLGDGVLCNPTNPTVFNASPSLSIPDEDGDPNTPIAVVSSTINVANSMTIGDVNVRVHIPDHTYIQDLVIDLVHGATSVRVWGHGCGGEDGMNATFDDDGDDVVCVCHLTANIKPAGSGTGLLSAFDGMDAQGDWELRVYDEYAGDAGTLMDWELSIGAPGDPCGAQPGCPQAGCVDAVADADMDGDCDVDLTDLAFLLTNFGTPSGMSNEQGDADGDGDVDLTDLAYVLSRFGTDCSP